MISTALALRINEQGMVCHGISYQSDTGWKSRIIRKWRRNEIKLNRTTDHAEADADTDTDTDADADAKTGHRIWTWTYGVCRSVFTALSHSHTSTPYIPIYVSGNHHDKLCSVSPLLIIRSPPSSTSQTTQESSIYKHGNRAILEMSSEMRSRFVNL